MKVYLAGYNVDTQVLEELQAKTGRRDDVTPEVISAAYARISRDPKPINEIRQEARLEVERSRKSNQTIIFKMGHHSVAEHSVFNLDILGASRLAMEELEKFRLCSYTEKSQRYITLDKDFVVPKELVGTGLEKKFIGMVKRQNDAYFELLGKLKTYVFKNNPRLAEDQKKHNLLEGWAKEDARYITALATQSQAGLTINARNLELMLRRFASSPLLEIKDLGRLIYKETFEVAPSIVIFHQANDRDRKTYPQLRELAAGLPRLLSPRLRREASKAGLTGTKTGRKGAGEVEIVDYTRDADLIIAAAILHTSSAAPFKRCLKIVRKMPRKDKELIFKTAWRNMQFYDSLLREFEYAGVTFDIVLSAACFGQLKRHRMSTITIQDYDPRLGLTIPRSIKEIGMAKYFKAIADESAEVYNTINKTVPLAAPYILTNAHRRRVLMRVSARELCHISRLREDSHAQWDIQNISRAMSSAAKKIMPLTCALIGGKDKYNEIYQNVFGELPKVTESILPETRQIK
jgi:flavin-dependent thymidylate synthase